MTKEQKQQKNISFKIKRLLGWMLGLFFGLIFISSLLERSYFIAFLCFLLSIFLLPPARDKWKPWINKLFQKSKELEENKTISQYENQLKEDQEKEVIGKKEEIEKEEKMRAEARAKAEEEIKERKKKEEMEKAGMGFLALLIIVVAMVIIFSIVGNGKIEEPVDWRDKDNSIAAYVMMERFVKQNLYTPATADFPGIWDGQKDHVEYLGNQKYLISSYVDAENRFGAKIRTYFKGVIQQTGEENWTLVELKFLE